jgi:tRNA(fMet)-specific endonuclease VapC
MFVLDTDTYTHLHFEHPGMEARATSAATAGESVAITVITKAEILRGRIDALLKADERNRFLVAQRQLALTEQALERIEIVPIDNAALDHFERLTRTRVLRRIGRADLLIAAIVQSRGATLVTRNVRHFGLIPGLKHTNWVD